MKNVVYNHTTHIITITLKPTVKIQDGSDIYMFHINPGQSIDISTLGLKRSKPKAVKGKK